MALVKTTGQRLAAGIEPGAHQLAVQHATTTRLKAPDHHRNKEKLSTGKPNLIKEILI